MGGRENVSAAGSGQSARQQAVRKHEQEAAYGAILGDKWDAFFRFKAQHQAAQAVRWAAPDEQACK